MGTLTVCRGQDDPPMPIPFDTPTLVLFAETVFSKASRTIECRFLDGDNTISKGYFSSVKNSSELFSVALPKGRVTALEINCRLPMTLCELELQYEGQNYLSKKKVKLDGPGKLSVYATLTDGKTCAEGDPIRIRSFSSLAINLMQEPFGADPATSWDPQIALDHGVGPPQKSIARTPPKPVTNTTAVASSTTKVATNAVPSKHVFTDSSLFSKAQRTQYQSALVIVKAGGSTGSGFVYEKEGKQYIITNQHVIQGSAKMAFTTLKGLKLKPTSIEVANSGDMVRIGIESSSLITAIKAEDGIPTSGDHVLVMGNSDGAGVVTELQGRVLAVGPDEVEVDAAFVSGNSGSPLFTTNFNVIGIATYVKKEKKEDWINKDTRFNEVRRFATRIGPDTKWKPVSLKTFVAQGKVLNDYDLFLDDLLTCMRNIVPRGGRWGYIKGSYLSEIALKNYTQNKYATSMKNLYGRFGSQGKQPTSPGEAERLNRMLQTELISRLTMLKSGLRGKKWTSQFYHEQAKYLYEFSDYLQNYVEGT